MSSILTHLLRILVFYLFFGAFVIHLHLYITHISSGTVPLRDKVSWNTMCKTDEARSVSMFWYFFSGGKLYSTLQDTYLLYCTACSLTGHVNPTGRPFSAYSIVVWLVHKSNFTPGCEKLSHVNVLGTVARSRRDS
jgi:hypothetical protein